MAISDEALAQAIVALSEVSGISMDSDALAEDVFLLGRSFPSPQDFMAAVLATARVMRLVAQGRVTSSSLDGIHGGWMSYHFQHAVGQGVKADMRLEWRNAQVGVQVRGFGHRWVPADFYKRLSQTR